jgi:hypothetical protein
MFGSEAEERSRRSKASVWRRASCCAGGECVEVSRHGDEVMLRSSNDHVLVLTCRLAGWRALIRAIRAGEFDLPV